jgi:hypothetical protein
MRVMSEEEKLEMRVAWTSSEHNITDSKADVLVIFDCCEAASVGGSLSRGPNPNFEYIVACGEKKLTRKPGPKSFTSALIWSLEELSESGPFTSSDLVSKTKKYPKLPKGQTPQLRKKAGSNGYIWLAPIGRSFEPAAVANSILREADHEFIDLRFDYYQKVNVEDAEYLAQRLSTLVNSDERFAKYITLLNVSSDNERVSKCVDHWRDHWRKRKSVSSAIELERRDSPDEKEGT